MLSILQNNLEIVLIITIVLLSIFLIKLVTKVLYYRKRFSGVIEIDDEVKKVTKEKYALEKETENLRNEYKKKRNIYENLLKEIAIFDEQLAMAELGFYKPQFDFDTSEKFKNEIEIVKSAQKEMLSDKTAIFSKVEWTVEGSKAKGRTMTNRAIRLTARAFNNECDAAVSKVKWNNIEVLEKRLVKAFEAINKLNESNKIEVSKRYLDLKLKELFLTHEYKEKKQAEKEEQAEINRQIREEAKFQEDKEKALKEEEKIKKLLEKAQKQAEKEVGDKLYELNEKIKTLSDDLEEAHSKSERAISMAQQTKAGNVYVISNIGSFGENVYKIGMTRRLEPLDRVKELSGASVPFSFDVHAIIRSDDAPNLEKSLHKVFSNQRVNLVNTRKEFFEVDLKEIEREVGSISPEAEFFTTAEAREYKESQAIRRQQGKSSELRQEPFPESL